MKNRSMIWFLLAFIPVMMQGGNVVTPNEVSNVCGIASNTSIRIHDDNMSDRGVTNSVSSGLSQEQLQEQEQELPISGIKRIWLFISTIILSLLAVIDWCSNHVLWRSLVRAAKWIVQILNLRNGKKSSPHMAAQEGSNQRVKIGDLVDCKNVTFNIGLTQSSKQHNHDSNNTGTNTDPVSQVTAESLKSGQKLKWDVIDKNFNPYKLIKVKATLKQILKDNLFTIDQLRASCPKKHIPICVIDDKDDEKYREGLKTLGYENVTIYPKCPSYEALKTFSIVIFDVKGVGNAAGKDGFSLAVNFKLENPLKVVGVRSAFLQGTSEEDRNRLDFAIEKKRDLCEQVAPVLNLALKDVGDPVAMWKKVQRQLIETTSVKELALMEHEYVHAIFVLSQETDVLPGAWMEGVNRLLKRNIF